MFKRIAAAAAVAGLILWHVVAPLEAAVTATPVFVQTPTLTQTLFIQGTDAAGTYKTIYTGGSNGSKITGIFVTSNDTAVAHLLTVQLSTSTTQHCATLCGGGAAVTIPINSGYANGAPAINILSAGNWPGLPRDSDGNPYIYLSGNTQTIEATFATALTASTQIGVNVVAGSF